MKHTPGPWESLDDCVRVNRPGDPDHHIIVCRVPPYLVGNGANARLISAAPELLEACRAAKVFIRNGVALGYIRMPDKDVPDPAHKTPEMLRAAIRTATGGE